MALRQRRAESEEVAPQTVKVILGYDVANPLIGEVAPDDSFETLLNKIAPQGDFDATQLRNSGYSPIVAGRAYSFSDNVVKALRESNAKEINFMTKQKGG